MQRCLLDTSICVDLFMAGLLETTLRLGHAILLVDVVAEELKDPPGRSLVELGFLPVSLEGEYAGKVSQLIERYPAPSTVDLVALVYAQTHECILLTGDSALRSAAVREGVAVHGVLWILDELVEHRVLEHSEAADALDRMIVGGSWLPQDECRRRLRLWRGPH